MALLEGFANTPTPGTPAVPWSSLAAGLGSGETTLTIDDDTPFPQTFAFWIVVGARQTNGTLSNAERMHVTAGAGSPSWTVTRTRSIAHASGESVYHHLDANALAVLPRSLTTAGDTEYLSAALVPARWAAPGGDGAYVARWQGGAWSWQAFSAPDLSSYLTTAAAAAAYQPIGNYVPTSRTVNGHALSADLSVSKGDLSLGNVENTALSTWPGSTNLTTLGTIGSGAWNATAIPVGKGGTGSAFFTVAGPTAARTYSFPDADSTIVTLSAAQALSNKSGAISQWTNDAGYLTSVSAHNLLSATHGDTTAASVTRGALITGQGASAKWASLAVGAANGLLSTDGTDVSWATANGTGAPARTTNVVFVTPSIAKLANLTSNGFVKTSGGDGTLSVDGTSYLSSIAPLVLGSNLVEQYNGTSPQTSKIYETRTDASNYSRLSISCPTGGPITFASEAAGTGVQRRFALNNTLTVTNGIFVSGTTEVSASAGDLYLNYSSGSNVYVARGSSAVFGFLTTSIIFQMGGATSAFPALKRSSAILQARLADDSAFAQVQGKLTTDANATTGLTAGVVAATTNATITITDASGQVYRVPCII